MDEEIVQQIFDELLSSLEPLDTQTAAVLQFLKGKGIANDEELAPYLEQAGNASNVRWLAARVRIRSLISSAMRPADQADAQPAETRPTKTTESSSEPAAETRKEPAQEKQPDHPPQSAQSADDDSKPDQSKAAIAGNTQNKKESKPAKSDEDRNQDAA
jgi:hypothetical protein